MKTRKAIKICAVILFLAGLAITFKGGYIHAKAVVAQILLKHAWQKTLNGQQQVRPWPWADTWPIARLNVPRYGIEQIILEGDTGNVLAFGPGRMLWSAKPGQTGNTIISGHRDTSFKFLENVKVGDHLHIQTNKGKKLTYVVRELIIQEATNITLPLETEIPTMTFITCYPFRGIRNATSRFLVSAVLIDEKVPI